MSKFTILVIGACLAVFGIVLQLFDRLNSPSYLLLEQSKSPKWLGWIGWGATALGALILILVRFL